MPDRGRTDGMYNILFAARQLVDKRHIVFIEAMPHVTISSTISLHVA